MDKRVRSRRFLPPDPRVEGPYRFTPKLALRVGLLGMLALAVFATLFLRLWSLQVLNGQQLLRAAQNNQRRDIRVQAPRGPILDRNGQVLVTNVPGTAVQIWISDLPKRRGVRLQRLTHQGGAGGQRLGSKSVARLREPEFQRRLLAEQESARPDALPGLRLTLRRLSPERIPLLLAVALAAATPVAETSGATVESCPPRNRSACAR